jgi:hypothetical protein
VRAWGIKRGKVFSEPLQITRSCMEGSVLAEVVLYPRGALRTGEQGASHAGAGRPDGEWGVVHMQGDEEAL